MYFLREMDVAVSAVLISELALVPCSVLDPKRCEQKHPTHPTFNLIACIVGGTEVSLRLLCVRRGICVKTMDVHCKPHGLF